jgi:hypothetical protein
MKKIITIILILALIIPTVSMAVSRDRIIGYWYMNVDNDYYPEFMANYGDFDSAFSAYYFTKSGRVMLLENDVKDDSGTPSFLSVGTWEKVKNKMDTFSCQIIGIGEGTIVIKDNESMELTNSQKTTFRLWRMRIFNPYSDITYQ